MGKRRIELPNQFDDPDVKIEGEHVWLPFARHQLEWLRDLVPDDDTYREDLTYLIGVLSDE